MKDTENKLRKGQKVSELQKLELLTDFNKGMSSVERTIKYGVTPQRQNQILHELEAMGHTVNWYER